MKGDILGDSRDYMWISLWEKDFQLIMEKYIHFTSFRLKYFDDRKKQYSMFEKQFIQSRNIKH